jgi:UDP-N-acetylmuramoyl-tripeptide--D-alanyl-D-alanine ligase
VEVFCRVVGKHNVFNATAAALAIKAVCPEVLLDEIKSGLEKFKAPYMRLNFISTNSGITLVDDTYNANLGSMGAMLDLVENLRREEDLLDIGLVLGQMNELGDFAETMHYELGRRAAQTGVKNVLFMGDNAADFISGAAEENLSVEIFTDFDAASSIISKWPVKYIFFKASRGLEFEKLVQLVAKQL